jgi:uncharacterized heparinase superfamily protein
MDRYQKQNVDGDTPWWQRFRLLDRGKQQLDRSLDRFIGPDRADCEILFVPMDIATTDPSLLHELEGGLFGLDGILVDLDQAGSLLDAPHVDDAFRRALHGFSWLRDLAAVEASEAAAMHAQHIVFDWLDRHQLVEGLAFEPEVLARRILSLLAHANLVTRGLDERHRRRFVRALAGQVAVLRARLPETPAGPPRLGALAALAMAGICLSRHGDLADWATPLLEQELDLQILPDGGHVSRNGDILLHLLFDLVPLAKCYITRDHRAPAGLARAIERMLPMIRFLRLGDSSLARFNGVSSTPTDALAILFANDERKLAAARDAPDSGYARLEAGPAIVIADVGAPASGADALAAHAGCLAFELSVRHFALVVNAGAYRGDDEEWRRYARSTGAHSTLLLDDRSQGGFDAGGALVGPREVQVIARGEREVEASHGGYVEPYGLVHRRRLELSPDGLQLAGIDRLERAGQALAGGSWRPCRIRFHLHPYVELSETEQGSLLLRLPDGEVWRFSAEGAVIHAEDSVYLAYRRGIEPAHQIVVTADAQPGLEVRWQLEQVLARPQPAAVPAATAETL